MIRVNLLPLEDRRSTRRLTLPSFSGAGPKMVWLIAAVVVYVGMIVAMATLQLRSVKDLEGKIELAKKEAQELAPQLAKIKKLTKEREEVNKRLNIIATLDRDRYFRAQIMNDVSQKLPSNCWLTSLKEQGGSQFLIEGVTFSNYIIADLMNNLERSDRFASVMLNIAQEGRIEEHNVLKFKLETITSR
jgi:type IV pilus assembly protein PilN